MSLAFLLVMALAPDQPPQAAPTTTAATPPGVEEQEIVVTATRKGKCRIQRADQTLSDRQFDKNAGEWASLGTPVRVVTPTRADYKCLAKIVFRLNDRGVRLIQFVDRAAPR
jgi:biopolymer transport protein ExbD